MQQIILNFLTSKDFITLNVTRKGQISFFSITIQNYRAIEAAYAKEFIRAVDSSSLSSSQLTFVQQVVKQDLKA